jgi:hypothetical protein
LNEIFVKFTYLVGMIADQNFYHICFTVFYPTASATAYGQRPKFVRAKHSATAEGENCACGPTLVNQNKKLVKHFVNFVKLTKIFN